MRDEVVSVLRRYGDEVLAATITAVVLIGLVVGDISDPDISADVAVALALGVAAGRRSRMPLLFLGLLFAISVMTVVGPDAVPSAYPAGAFAFLLLGVYSAAAHTSGRATQLAGGMTAGIYAMQMVVGGEGFTADAVVFDGLLVGAPWITGRAMRQRRAEIEREKGRAAVAIVEERARIARELHDVVAHSISVMVLQARGGRRVLDSEPADARAAFGVIEWTGQQALDEMRRLVGMLRSGDEFLPLAPQPSLREIDRLVEHVRAAGLPVHVAVEGEPRELPPGVDLSAFRIVQEALTNALKHAGPARARVVLRYRPDELELEVSDDGPGTGDTPGSGYGLVGMRERVTVYGGELHAGRRPEGGYALRVRLPLGSARA